jgi:leader peptidase (prepilin peptidase)/N-methyltransferase
MIRALVFAAFGLLIGSFLTVVVWRVPRKEPIVSGRSKCPSCGATIGARDNVPVLSWLLLRGRCRSCGARISPVYPLTELATAGLFAGASLAFDDLYAAIVMAAFLGFLVAIAFIDIRHRIIPNRMVYPAAPVFLVAVAVGDLAGWGLHLTRALIGLAAFGGAFLLIAVISPRGMGMGDVKLAALIGLVVGSMELARMGVAAGAAILLGGVGAILALTVGKRGRKSALPFGPFLAAGAAVAIFWGHQIADAYLRVMT